MSADNIQTLAGTTIEVLESYAFLLGGPSDAKKGPPPFADPSWLVILAFSGSRAGGVGMVVSPAMARQVAANLAGTEPTQVSDEQARDAAKELLNIVCGKYLHQVGPREALFDFAAPACFVVAREKAVQYAGGKPQATLEVEDHPLLVFIEN
jgi:CheY-specific phosphatase CheX